MRKQVWGVLMTLALSSTATPASAALYADELSKCVVAKTTDADQLSLVKWVFAAMTAHPELAVISRVTSAERARYDRAMADLFMRLLSVDCRNETVAAIKYEGYESLKTSFGVLGEVAMRSLMANPAVEQSVGKFAELVDYAKLDALATEAGVKPPPRAPITPAK